MKPSVVLLLLSAMLQTGLAQQPVLAPNAPKDRPTVQRSLKDFDRAIGPYVAQAKATYPQAKRRFLAGLPTGENFFLTTRLTDAKGNVEQVFIAVHDIRDGQVIGRIWSQIMRIDGYRYGDPITFPENRMLDWLITKPDGTEEGNVVGKFLDTYGR